MYLYIDRYCRMCGHGGTIVNVGGGGWWPDRCPFGGKFGSCSCTDAGKAG